MENYGIENARDAATIASDAASARKAKALEPILAEIRDAADDGRYFVHVKFDARAKDYLEGMGFGVTNGDDDTMQIDWSYS